MALQKDGLAIDWLLNQAYCGNGATQQPNPIGPWLAGGPTGYPPQEFPRNQEQANMHRGPSDDALIAYHGVMKTFFMGSFGLDRHICSFSSSLLGLLIRM